MAVKSIPAGRAKKPPRATKGARPARPGSAKRKPAKRRVRALSRKALEFLVANSPTPEIFNEVPERPPFDLQDK
jgi:hypothetical protein